MTTLSPPGTGDARRRGRLVVLSAVFAAGALAGATAQGLAGAARDDDAVATIGGANTPPPAPMAAATVTGATTPGGSPAADTADTAMPGARADAATVAPVVAGDDAAPGPDPAAVALAAVGGRLAALRSELDSLRRRVASLEHRPAPAAADVATGAAGDGDAGPPPMPVRTPEDRWAALLSAGVDAALADDILDRQSRQQLARLELRDRAAREGWADGERFREEIAALRDGRVDLREAIGESAYDLYLYNTGTPNRVRVGTVMQGSAAERYGLQPGDVIESYADGRVFTPSQLRAATTAGIRGETVPVQIRRGGELLEAWLPRGPIGIGLETVRTAPMP